MSRPARYGQARPRVRTRPDAESSLPPVGRRTPAARAYSNAARAGRTTAGRREVRSALFSRVLERLLGSHRSVRA